MVPVFVYFFPPPAYHPLYLFYPDFWITWRSCSAGKIKVLTERLKKCESTAEYGEKTVQKLNLRIDGIMADLVTEKMKTENFNEQLDDTFEVFMNV